MLQQWLPSIIAGLALSGSSAMAQYVIADFATGVNGSGTGGSVGPSQAWDSAVGIPAGSLYVTCNWLNQGGWQDAQFAFNQTIDMSKYVNIEVDVKVDKANSTPDSDGNYGGYQLIANGWNGHQGWTPLGSGPLYNISTNNGWQHLKASTSAYAGTADAIVVALYMNPSATPKTAGPCKYWIDNLVATTPPLPLPKIVGIKNASANGLTLLPTGGGNYQRTMVYPGATAGADYSWHNKTFPVTYSFDIKDFPSVPSYIANLFVIPQNSGNVPNGLGDTSVDWNCKYGLFFNVGAPTNTPVTNWNVNLTFKTNDAGRNPQYQLTNFNYGQLPVGTWTLKFTDNTHLTLTAPDQTVKSLVIPADIEAMAADVADGTSAMVYIGGQNNSTANIGVPIVIDHIGLTNGTTDVNDNFTTLNTNTLWALLQSTTFGVSVQTGDQFKYVYWQTPNDSGFSSLSVAGAVTGPWIDLCGPTNWYVVQPDADSQYHQTLITRSAMAAATGGTQDQTAFFRLLKRQMSKLQVLFPGEANAPNTATGKTGTPLPVSFDTPTPVTINAVDATYHIVNSGDTINITATDSQLLTDNMNPSLSQGTWTGNVYFETTGPQTITVTDTNFVPNITATSATVNVQ